MSFPLVKTNDVLFGSQDVVEFESSTCKYGRLDYVRAALQLLGR